MHLFDELNKENFLLFAAKHYNNPQCTAVDEFYDDLNRFKYLKRLFSRYHNSNDLQERLILNHIIILYNVFGIPAANHMMKYQIDDKYMPYLKPFLILLNYIESVDMVEIPLDQTITDRLRNI